MVELIEEARSGGEYSAGASGPTDHRDNFPVQWVLGTYLGRLAIHAAETTFLADLLNSAG